MTQGIHDDGLDTGQLESLTAYCVHDGNIESICIIGEWNVLVVWISGGAETHVGRMIEIDGLYGKFIFPMRSAVQER